MLFPNVLDQLLRATPSNHLEDLFLDHRSPNILYLFVLRKNGKIKVGYRGLLLMFSLLSTGMGVTASTLGGLGILGKHS